MSAAISEPLDSIRIQGALPPTIRRQVTRLDVVDSIESTNSALMAPASPPVNTCEILLAEFQTAGRGRRGRSWHAAPGSAICLSLSWTFAQMPRDISALSVAIGVCVLRALEVCGVKEARLKWPNDILIEGRKLGGILIELRSESVGSASVVIGMGLNTALGRDFSSQLDTLGVSATDLASHGFVSISRNTLAASLIEACIEGLAEFGNEGLRPFIEEWRAADALHGRLVSVQTSGEIVGGYARGIDLSGALVVETPQGVRRFISGDVMVRPAA